MKVDYGLGITEDSAYRRLSTLAARKNGACTLLDVLNEIGQWMKFTEEAIAEGDIGKAKACSAVAMYLLRERTD